MTDSADRIALAATAATLTYGDMREQVRLFARRLKTLGIGERDTVALLGRNSVDWALLAHAIPAIGATLMPINARLTHEEIEEQLTRARASAILHEEGFAIPDLPLLALTTTDLRTIAPAEEPIPDSRDPNRPCALLFTSGTTGRPKGVVLTWANLVASAQACASTLQLGPDDRWLICLPLFHIGGLNILYRCALHGACAVLHERFDPGAVNAAIDGGGVTLLSVVSVMLRRILADRHGRPFPGTLRAVVVGGGAVEPALIDACPHAIATYGLTETCSMVTLVHLGASREARLSAGRPLPGITLRIVDEKGAPLPPHKTGMVEVRGPVVMRGYLGEAPRRPDDWFRTGDLGCLDRAGLLHLAGRREDLIVSGGENVYPAEIEVALLLHPEVSEAVVIGVPDAMWGGVPLALIVPHDPSISIDTIVLFLEERLAGYKIPRIVSCREIPRLPNGKPDRASIASRFAE